MFRRRLTSAVAALTLAMTGAFVALPAYADERSDLVDQQEENEQRIAELQSTLEGVDLDLQQAYLDLENTRSQIPGAEAELASAENAVAAAVREAEANSALLDAAQTELETISAQIAESEGAAESTRYSLAEMARATYRGETVPSAIDLALGSASPEEYANAFRVNSAVTRSQTAALTELEQEAANNRNRETRQVAVEERVTELKEEADALVVVTQEARDTAAQRKAELDALEASIAVQTEDLAAQQATYEASLQAIEEENASVARRIAAIDEENRRKEAERLAREAEARRQAEAEAERQRQAEAEREPQRQNAPAPAPVPSNYWMSPPIPKPYVITSPYGWRIHPFGGRAMHQGVDMRSACGDPQYAAASGTVVDVVPASRGGFGGNIVYLNHGIVNGSSYVTAYLHLSRFNVRLGQQVNKGQIIGWTGMTGRVTGCHVHFEVWKNGSTINPMGLPGF